MVPPPPLLPLVYSCRMWQDIPNSSVTLWKKYKKLILTSLSLLDFFILSLIFLPDTALLWASSFCLRSFMNCKIRIAPRLTRATKNALNSERKLSLELQRGWNRRRLVTTEQLAIKVYPLFIVFIFGIFFCFVLFCSVFFFFFFFFGGGGGGWNRKTVMPPEQITIKVYPFFLVLFCFWGVKQTRKLCRPSRMQQKCTRFFFLVFFFCIFLFCFLGWNRQNSCAAREDCNLSVSVCSCFLFYFFWSETDKTVMPPKQIAIKVYPFFLVFDFRFFLFSTWFWGETDKTVTTFEQIAIKVYPFFSVVISTHLQIHYNFVYKSSFTTYELHMRLWKAKILIIQVIFW